ncbi:hypothetical protein [Pseudomonas schmalbachii]|uniref:Uncharacterized protein n=1 Tax=Pseudomonas schmalbachii TaxID=2816993 RepID=A0ABS3TM45_9PSED|nr:hypothetical protein [Pseudomonas schmalbachii]MBO3274734.1 hypothetical protein [Pseudomonas schmalbachii]
MDKKGEILALRCMLEAVIAVLPPAEQKRVWQRFRRNAALLYHHLDAIGQDAFERAAISLAASRMTHRPDKQDRALG